jgi:hypothetical protein
MKPEEKKNAILRLTNALTALIKDEPVQSQLLKIETDDDNVFAKVKSKIAKLKEVKSEDSLLKEFSKIEGLKRIHFEPNINGIQIQTHDGSGITYPWDEVHPDYPRPVCLRCYRRCFLIAQGRRICIVVCKYEFC